MSLYNEETKELVYDYITAAMAPYGDLAIFLEGAGILTSAAWIKGEGEEIEVEWKDFLPQGVSREEYVNNTPKRCEKAYENYLKNGMPDTMLFENYMKKFN